MVSLCVPRGILILGMLCVLVYLAGCAATQPASRQHYTQPVPLEDSESSLEPVPIVRWPTKQPDVRFISSYRPELDHLHLRAGFSHPAADTHLQEIFLQDVPLSIATELLNEVSGVNLMLQASVADTPVRLYLRDVNLATAVESLLRSNGLWYRTDGLVTAVMNEQAFMDSMLFKETEKIQAFFMRYTNAKDMAALLSTLLGPDVEFRELSGESVYGHLTEGGEGASAGTVTAREVRLSTHDRLQLLDMLPDTGLIDTELASQRLGRRPESAVIITVMKKNNAIIVRSMHEGLLRHITGLIQTLDTPIRQVLLEVRILRLQLGDGFESFFDFSGQSRDGRRSFSALGGVAPLEAATLAMILPSSRINTRLQLFAQEDRLNTVSSPFLMTADNTAVRFFVGQQVPLRTGVSKETVRGVDTPDLVIFLPQVSNREIGTDLELSSFINADHTITMEIAAVIEAPNIGVSSIPLVNERTGQVVNFPLDGVDKSELTSVLSIPSGHTVALGGFIRVEDQDFERKVPIAGDLPLLGALFRRTERRAIRNETIILITPHILGSPDESQARSRQFLDQSSQVLEESRRSRQRIEQFFEPAKSPSVPSFNAPTP